MAADMTAETAGGPVLPPGYTVTREGPGAYAWAGPGHERVMGYVAGATDDQRFLAALAMAVLGREDDP